MNYGLTYTSLTNNNIPPNHRFPVIQSLFACFTKPLQWLHDWFFNKKVNGYVYASYDETAIYNIGDYVYNYWIDTSGTPITKGDMCVYICIQNTTAGITCDNENYFYKINDSIFGLNTYNYLNAQVILFEYALNIAFNTIAEPLAFKQPSSGLRSGIFIQNLESNIPFTIGYIEDESGNVIYSNPEAQQFVYASNQNPNPYNYVINIPYNLYLAINETGATDYQIISQIANKFNLSGISYTIQFY
jgi:hypothetical protein